MISTSDTNESSDSLTLSAEAYRLIQKDRIQSLTNKLTYVHGLTDWERQMLLAEIETLEAEESLLNLSTNQSIEMYKPEPESLETLETRKTELMNKIINGSHLDALSMSALQKQLADVRRKIEERKEEASGQ